MKKNMKKILFGILVIGIAVSLCGLAMAGPEISISGVINENGQLVDDKGAQYDITENEQGAKVMDMIGQKVTLKGTVMEDEGAKIITITEFKVLDK